MLTRQAYCPPGQKLGKKKRGEGPDLFFFLAKGARARGSRAQRTRVFFNPSRTPVCRVGGSIFREAAEKSEL